MLVIAGLWFILTEIRLNNPQERTMLGLWTAWTPEVAIVAMAPLQRSTLRSGRVAGLVAGLGLGLVAFSPNDHFFEDILQILQANA